MSNMLCNTLRIAMVSPKNNTGMERQKANIERTNCKNSNPAFPANEGILKNIQHEITTKN